jgi:hypothetical protein
MSRQRRMSLSATQQLGPTMTGRRILDPTCLHEFGSYRWPCSDESPMMRLEDFGINFCTRQPLL